MSFSSKQLWETIVHRMETDSKFGAEFNKRKAWDKIYYNLVWPKSTANILVTIVQRQSIIRLGIYNDTEEILEFIKPHISQIEKAIGRSFIFRHRNGRASDYWIEYSIEDDSATTDNLEQITDWIEEWSLKIKAAIVKYTKGEGVQTLGGRETHREQNSIKMPSINWDDYEFIKAICPDKDVAWLRRKRDGKLLVRKQYEQYNKAVFERILKLDVDGIPHFYLCEEADGVLYTLEDYIEGRDLQSILTENGVFDEERVRNIAISVCDILEKLHALNPPLIHRDIKPSNIIETVCGDIVLVDFNISKEYHTGNTEDTVCIGTKDFAAPEQVGFGVSDERTDIYGLGSTMNYLLTKMSPLRFVAPGPLEKIIEKCKEIDKNARFKNVTELKKALLEVKVV